MTEPASPLSAGPTPSTGLFRAKALARLSSPDHLDELVRVVPSLGWLTLAAVLLVVAGALVWGFIGSVPRTVSGKGILLSGGMISAVTSQGTGQLAALEVAPGDAISVGQTIGVIRQPLLEARLRNQRLTVANRLARFREVKAAVEKTLESQVASFHDQLASLQGSLKNYEQQVASQEKVLAAQEKLQAEGLISFTLLLQTRAQLYSTRLQIDTAKGDILKLQTEELSAHATASQNIYGAETSWQTEVETLQELEAEDALSSQIVSTLAGRVVNVAAAIGQDVSPGSKIVELERTDLDMVAVLYFPAGQGKQVTPGMLAQVSPGTTPVDKYGFIVGRVSDVAAVPATPGSMMALLSNQNLVDAMMAEGPPLNVRATLLRDPATVSGFQWSTSHGPSLKIPSGTICSARVIVEQQRPITLVVPLLKRFFGLAD